MFEYLVQHEDGRAIGFLKTTARPTTRGGLIAVTVPEALILGTNDDAVSLLYLRFVPLHSQRSGECEPTVGWALRCARDKMSQLYQLPRTTFETVAERYHISDDQLRESEKRA